MYGRSLLAPPPFAHAPISRGRQLVMQSGAFYSRGLSLTSRLDSPPSTPLGQGNIFHGSSPSSVSSTSSEIAGISAKLDQVLAAFSGQSQLLAETKQEG